MSLNTMTCMEMEPCGYLLRKEFFREDIIKPWLVFSASKRLEK